MSVASEILKAYNAGAMSRQEIESIATRIVTMVGIAFRFEDGSSILFSTNGEVVESYRNQ